MRVSAMAASFLVGVQLAHMLGVSGYGYYGLALSIVTIASIPGELGISRLVTREVAASTAASDHAELFGVLRWGTRLATKLSLAVMVALGTAGLVLLRTSPVLGACLLAASPSVPLMILARVKGGALQGLHHIVRGQIPGDLLRPLIFSAVLFVAYLYHIRVGPVVATGLWSLAAAAIFTTSFIWLRRRLPPRAPPSAASGRKWIASSLALALNQSMFVIQSELSILLIGLIAAPSAVGLFRVASASANIAAAGTSLMVYVAGPVIAKLYAQGDSVRLQKAVTAFAWLQLGSVGVLCLPLLAAPELLIRIIFGPGFVPAATAMRLLAAGQIVNALFGPTGQILNMSRNERRVTRAMAAALAVNLLLVPLLTLIWGIAGTAAAMLLSTLTWNFLAWRDAKRLVGIQSAVLLRSS